jgi:hypothetical protein
MQFVLKEGLVSNQILGGSRVALEEAFFARESAKLRQQLRDLDDSSGRRRRFRRPQASPMMPCSRSWLR